VGLPKWYPPIESSKLVLGRNNEVGAIRELTRRNGTKVEEKLIDYDPWNRTMTYTYAEGQPLSSDYFATVTVKDAGNGKSLVEWKARFKRLAYWTDDPPAGQDDETVTKALNAGYKLGLENLKKLAEAQ
jgi:mxaD protein